MSQKNTIKTTQKTTMVPNTPLSFIWFVTKPHVRFFLCAALTLSIAEILETSTAYIFKSIIDTANDIIVGTGQFADLWKLAIIYPIVLLGIGLSWRLSGFIGMQWATRANATAYKALFKYLSFHSHAYFSNRFAGSLSSKVTHASEGTQSIIEAFLWNYFPTTLSLIITSVYLGYTNIYIALIFYALIAILIPVNILLAKYRRPHVVEYAAQATKARGYAVDAITNIAAVRQFSRVEDEQRNFHTHIEMMRTLNLKQWRISEWGLLLNNVLIVLFEAVILLYSIHLFSKGLVTVGDLVMIVALLANIQGSLIHIGNNINGFIRRFADIQEGLSDIVVEYEIRDRADAQVLESVNGNIEWKKVTFDYGDNTVFNKFDLTIPAGQRIGLVGGSGAGKTTFVSLLLRQHELGTGEILIDGHNIAEVTQDSLREHVSVVPQEPMLFHRTIRDNIAYGKPDATDEEIIAVAKKAQAHDFIVSLKEGYDTLVGERGVKLSGGQKQRVAIARAMLKDAPILVLDEATSALDSESEVAIQKALHELMAGKTVIAIAHRLSTLHEMDRIIVLEQGKVLEDGTHDELVTRGSTYARLWEHQAGGFLVE